MLLGASSSRLTRWPYQILHFNRLSTCVEAHWFRLYRVWMVLLWQLDPSLLAATPHRLTLHRQTPFLCNVSYSVLPTATTFRPPTTHATYGEDAPNVAEPLQLRSFVLSLAPKMALRNLMLRFKVVLRVHLQFLKRYPHNGRRALYLDHRIRDKKKKPLNLTR